jgi:uncharacterized protein YjgD (DUF1641 family)
MAEQTLQEQINNINLKLDVILENIQQQQRKREEFEDLFQDLNIVAKDAFQQSVLMLDKAQIDLGSVGISNLIIKILQNLGTFYELLELMESARDFMKDATPILHQVGLDAVNKMNELDQKGYFEFINAMGRLMDRIVQTIHPEDIRRLEENMDNLAAIIRNLTDPAFISSLSKATYALSTLKMDDRLDNLSVWKLLMKMHSPEVRRSISYSLRLIKAINQQA